MAVKPKGSPKPLAVEVTPAGRVERYAPGMRSWFPAALEWVEQLRAEDKLAEKPALPRGLRAPPPVEEW
jgi:hypothetical protein